MTIVDYEYVYAPVVFGHRNNGFVYGIQEIDDFGYIEWFKTLKELEKNTKKHKFNVVNREEFLHRHGYYHIKIK